MNKLIVPVYLNQKLVFDLLAMLQGGISTVKTVAESSKHIQEKQEEVSANFGLNGAISSLLSISLGGKKQTQSNEQTDTLINEERIQTPASLFYQLNILLNEQNLIKKVTGNDIPCSGDFVEIDISLKKNPALEALETVHGLIDLIDSMQDANNTKHNKNLTAQKKQMSIFIDSLKSGNAIDMIYQPANGCSVVVSLEKEFLRDQSMSDIVEGQFKVLGKVINTTDDSGSEISLLRKSHFGKLPDTLIKDLFGKLIDPLKERNYSIPTLITSIPGPAIQIIPIAIYA